MQGDDMSFIGEVDKLVEVKSRASSGVAVLVEVGKAVGGCLIESLTTYPTGAPNLSYDEPGEYATKRSFSSVTDVAVLGVAALEQARDFAQVLIEDGVERSVRRVERVMAYACPPA